MPARADGGEFGVDGRRKGEALGPPKDSGDGLKPELVDCIVVRWVSAEPVCARFRHTIV